GEKEMIKISLREIRFIDSSKENARLHLEDGRVLLVRQSISALEKLLLPHRFLRVHRSYIVPAERVESYKGNRIKIGEQILPVGRLYKSQLEGLLKR
ncbi:MAG: LytTR family transcriptional regulator DNA-binding domain-containing protein, partial [Chitinophaga rupis]